MLPVLLVAGWLVPAVRAEEGASGRLKVEIIPCFAGAPLVFDAVTNVTAGGQRISVTRLDLLISGFALRQADGTWSALSAGPVYVSGRERRNSFEVDAISTGRFDRLRFHIGVSPRENHADPAALPPDHPLNPIVNGLHWSWQGGYVFLALEGAWEKLGGTRSGYSFHLATDRFLTAVEVPVELDLASASHLRLVMNVEALFSARHRLILEEGGASTHSRVSDPLAEQVAENLGRAFACAAREERATEPASAASVSARAAPRIEMASTATPYALRFSRFFPKPSLPTDNPLTEEGVKLGERLFHDTRLSVNSSQSCASCHQPDRGFSDPRRVSIGAEGQAGFRQSMPLLNLAWKRDYFWDGRAPTLRDQVLRPIQDAVEMHETLPRVVAKLGALEDNTDAFARAFGTPTVTADRIARALEQFLLTCISCDSRFDRSLSGEVELSEEEKRGFELFNTEYDPRRGQFGADCFHCHGGPLFQSQGFANNGLEAAEGDPGRAAVTSAPGDFGKFAVPSLRNVALTAPYMHDGRFATLEEVIDHYAGGLKRGPTLDPNLAKHPDGGVPLTPGDRRALVAFLRTLTGESIAGTGRRLPNGVEPSGGRR